MFVNESGHFQTKQTLSLVRFGRSQRLRCRLFCNQPPGIPCLAEL
jgi:hypothetical protein